MNLLKLRRLLSVRFPSCNLSSQSCDKVRVRFAPSPTGQLHVGGLRTALFNYLFAKAHNGKFILRLEDTDQTRLVPGAQENLINNLEWAGVQIDEGPTHGGDFGPYIQSQRLGLYQNSANSLIQSSLAYRCFCTEKRLDLLRTNMLQRNETPRYDNKCRELTETQVESNLEQGKPYVVRLKLEHMDEAWTDLVFGQIAHDIADIEGDPVLLKSDGFPTYHLANVVDDHHMSISHVMRGVEWLASTTKHHLLYKAFGWSPPKFAHLPSIINQDGKKLSKRQNDLHVEHLKNQGFSPEVLVNWLCSMSSGFTLPPSELQGLTLSEMVQYFDISRVNRVGTRLDPQRLAAISSEHLLTRLQHDKPQLLKDVKHTVLQHYHNEMSSLDQSSLTDEALTRRLTVILNTKRISVLKELVNPDWLFLWSSTTQLHTSDFLSVDKSAPTVLTMLCDVLSKMEDDKFEAFVNTVKTECKQRPLPFSAVMKLFRLAVYGNVQGPSIPELLEMFGKDACLSRLQHAATSVAKHNVPNSQTINST